MLTKLRSQLSRRLAAFVFLAIAFAGTHTTLARAESMSEEAMKIHREWSFTSHGYAEALSKELHVSLEVVQDFLNAYGLYLVQGTLLMTTQGRFQDYPQVRNTLVSLFLVHRLAYWGFSAMRYMAEMPLTFLTHAVLYQAVFWSAGLLPHMIEWQMKNNNDVGVHTDSIVGAFTNLFGKLKRS